MLHTAETETLTAGEMLALVRDWLGDCPCRPDAARANTDVLEVLMQVGVPPHVLAAMARQLARPETEWSRYAVGRLICKLVASPRVLAALARHGKLYHGLPLVEARRDLRALRGEARELVQREVLAQVGRHYALPH